MGWHLPEAKREPDIAYSRDYLRMDNTHPVYGEKTREKCPVCGELVVDVTEMKRMFGSTQSQQGGVG